MTALHKSQNKDQNFEPKEGQRGLLCSNKDPFRCPSLVSENFTSETIDSLVELGKVLKKIREELVSSGDYIITDGKISKKI